MFTKYFILYEQIWTITQNTQMLVFIHNNIHDIYKEYSASEQSESTSPNKWRLFPTGSIIFKLKISKIAQKN